MTPHPEHFPLDAATLRDPSEPEEPSDVEKPDDDATDPYPAAELAKLAGPDAVKCSACNQPLALAAMRCPECQGPMPVVCCNCLRPMPRHDETGDP